MHVKNAPVFVSDVTDDDVETTFKWCESQNPALAERLRKAQASGRLVVFSHSFYTSALPFWEMPEDLIERYSQASAVILKGDANFRRLLGDLHWNFDYPFDSFIQSFWPSPALICLRTAKSGVAIGISVEMQDMAMDRRPKDWLTSGRYGQILAAKTTVTSTLDRL